VEWSGDIDKDVSLVCCLLSFVLGVCGFCFEFSEVSLAARRAHFRVSKKRKKRNGGKGEEDHQSFFLVKEVEVCTVRYQCRT